jgi:hypothetical protein
MQVYGGSLGSTVFGYQFDGSGKILSSEGSVIGQYVTGSENYTIMTIQLDSSTGKMSVIQDGLVLYAADKQGLDAGIGGVKIIGYARVDYVRMGSSGTASIGVGNETSTLPGDATFLDSCNPLQNEAESLDERLSYTNVLLYCNSIDANSGCSYADLQEVVKSRKACTKEVMNYCVYVGYPKEEHLKLGEDPGVQGVTVCTTVLGVGSAVSGIVVPAGNVILDLLTANMTIFLVILVILVLAVIAALPRR